MEIGPIAGIGSTPMIRASTPSSDLAGVFGVEFRRQAHGDPPNRQPAARGLEDDEAEDEASSAEDESPPGEIALEAPPHPRVSFFAYRLVLEK